MTRLHASDSLEQGPATPGSATPAIFLHTGWRSAGTWIWSRCREQPGVRAWYEPLHERLAWLRPADIAALRPGAWASNHSETAPYFQEYGALLRGGTSGVPLYRRRFAFDHFFLAPEEADPELEAYLHALLAAAEPGSGGVLKFCRSLGRVGWMERRFPHALHVLLLRDPASQFASAQALLAGQRNRYFSVAPLMVLARNAAHPLVRQANAALGVRPPELHSDDLAYVTETCWRHVRRSSQGERYRQFLAFWAATALHALHSDAVVLESGKLAQDAAYRGEMEVLLGRVAGPGLSLAPRAGLSPREGRSQRRAPLLSAAELEEAHLAASVLIQAWAGTLKDERAGIVTGLLTGDRLHSLAQAIPAGRKNAWTVPVETRPTLARGGVWRRLLTFAQVQAARALQPVRRMHGRVARWQNRLPGRSADQIT